MKNGFVGEDAIGGENQLENSLRWGDSNPVLVMRSERGVAVKTYYRVRPYKMPMSNE